MVVSDAQVIDAQGNVLAQLFMATKHSFNGSVLATAWRNRYLGCAMAMRRSLFDIALPIPRQVPMHETWFGIMGRISSKVIYLPTPFLRYRRHTGNVSQSSRQPLLRMIRWRIALLTAICSRLLFHMLGIHGRSIDTFTKAADRAETPSYNEVSSSIHNSDSNQ